MSKNHADIDAGKIRKDARLVIAKYKAWDQTPVNLRPKEIKEKCVIKIDSGGFRWSNYIDALIEEVAKFGYKVSLPSRVIDAERTTILVCSVEKILAKA
mgnify:CR=1 FL=1